MLRDNLKTLRLASILMNRGPEDAGSFTRDELQEALRVFASLIRKTKNTQTKFSPGTSQHTLQRNRLKALRTAEAAIKAASRK